ncbi:hypothetical protein [Micromonospora sp. CB01531]|uniref:hypothetical protein n=1 Tax=Micromonospora sp. CB01531 TaxID=1718947 RepID=UPI00093F9D6D|nr:hypothetical protein [Micromonospora sp. CB01531]OKI54667.1 hypothetical protein A6A27_31630 [Micromonospora sp. CB01531]
MSATAVDTADPARLGRFFEELPGSIDYVMVVACSRTKRAWPRATSPRRAATRSGRPTSPALAVHIMTNTALTGATCDIDSGQQVVAASSD